MAKATRPTFDELEAQLRANLAGDWIETVQRAVDEDAEFVVLYYTAFKNQPSLLYTAADYADRRGLPVLLSAADTDDPPITTR